MAITKIAQVDVGAGGAASIDFTSIPGTYTDLQVVFSARTNGGSSDDGVKCELNGDTNTANYTYRRLLGDGSSAYSSTANLFFAGRASASTATSNTFGNSSLLISNYSGSAAKTGSADGVSENNASTGYQTIFANSWTGTAAVTSVKLLPQFGTLFVQYSSATLYGISKSGATGATVA
jgi:hypothetical protein